MRLTILTLFFLAACGVKKPGSDHSERRVVTDAEWKEITIKRKHLHGFAKYIYSKDNSAIVGYVVGDSNSFDPKTGRVANGDTLLLICPIDLPREEHVIVATDTTSSINKE